MAKYIGLLSADARGKLGGTIFSRSRSGTTLKGHVAPRQPRSSLQNNSRAIMSVTGSLWQSLSTSQKQGWSTLAQALTWTNVLGQSYIPTAQQLFTYCQTNLLRCALPEQLTAPSVSPLLPVILGVETYSSGSTNYGAFVDASSFPSTIYAMIYAGALLQAKLTTYRANLFRFIYSGVNVNANVNLASEYLAVFKFPANGQLVVFARLVDSATGFATPPIYSALLP
jgi:hypothetical protein